ncbi:MAG: tRNA preQ1(34) S-adenosylmethionine ribosyltransferase-isomerase QueA [Candidatus Magasanikbacteria bacterium RIFCSPLOWO2_02_FULL_44_11]|uniref:S-adenosylmethionine:tRNA ribosyltransferase-isomerase n=2 Tax=Candidatus Magasanikiibacteriota TaxID=1752731 RepID=A0A1F6N9V5_9BACT|nr:MAG: tRNA preQ1(34) S-adenosylmethionine ribosyltransferase-isomerase QueA [Candidatus Magasanikbacteria bacterium RIFCSPHIGHO2_02_FULL_45_10]OGH80712.1 MAG: tRNA preQ1(34) S-adenosylmethionine ribosyltransferase-isomerase QueA [Candidatus Magasanikbacteria bacterium RIFCSPLOWO2_02_FULL_44_11]
MKTKDFDFNLPVLQIAQTPAEPRDSSKLMVIDREKHLTQHKTFHDIGNYLGAGDVVVWNNSKVFKARLRGEIVLDDATDGVVEKIHPTGKILNVPVQVEIFLVRPMENPKVWKVLAKPGKKLRLGMKVVFAEDFEGEIIVKEADGTILMQFNDDDMVVRAKANKYGHVPTPPYIRNQTADAGDQTSATTLRLEESYQTVYATKEGSVAAPTAGFHFTPKLIEMLKKKGVVFAEVTLHVGLGTFLPVKTDQVEKHVMHSEWVELTDKNAAIINEARAEGRRIVAIGTTTVRCLEGVARLFGEGSGKKDTNKPLLHSYCGDINIFITPGFSFQVVDALVTNFHLPKSTLLMLVAAFIDDRAYALQCYQEAIDKKYRFYSFGDAMLIK